MVIKSHNKIGKVEANYTPLSPISFLSKAAKIFPEKTSIIYESQKFSWLETYSRCKKLASALSNQFNNGDVIGFLAANTPELYEAHFGVPMAGMVLNALNIRLDPKTIGYIIDHSEIKIIFADDEFLEFVIKAIEISYGCVYKRSSKPVMKGSRVESIEDARKEYKQLLEQGWKKTSIFKV